MHQGRLHQKQFRWIISSVVALTILATSTLSVRAAVDEIQKQRIISNASQPVHKRLDPNTLNVQEIQQDDKWESELIPIVSLTGWENIKTEGFEGSFPNDWDIYGDPMWDDVSCMSYTDDWACWCADEGTSPPSPCSEYANDMDTWMVYGPFDLSDASDAEVVFQLWLDVEESSDEFFVGASTDGSDFTGYPYSEDTAGWEAQTLNILEIYDYWGQSMGQTWVGFRFYSDNTMTYEGAYLDDIVIRKETGGVESDPCIRVDPESIELTCEGASQVRANVRPNRVTGQIDEKYIVDRVIDENGKELIKIIVPGKPPVGRRAAAAIPLPAAVTLPDMPAYDWSFGCSATSAAMISAYYDRNGFPNMYTGPTNGGVMPLDNSGWGSEVINGDLQSHCPLSATANGVDGRTTRGHVDDYWNQYGNEDDDPWITNGWVEHTWGDCTGDYMGTNQSSWGSSDGSTSFWWDNTGACLYDYTACEVSDTSKDGCHGFKEFMESRGYTVLENYSQYLLGFGNNPSLGFTFDDFMAEIDAGYPVLIQISGHTMVGYGYDEATQNIYIHDTWDYSDHVMPWGGSYEDMAHYGVTVLHLAGVEPPSFDYFTIHNDCAGDLIVGSISSDQFWCTPNGYPALPFTLEDGESQILNVDVDWSQIPAGSSDLAVVTITSNDPDDPTVDVYVDATNVDCSSECDITATAGCDTYCEGSEITVPFNVDMSLMPSPDQYLGSYTATLYWDPAQLEYTGYTGGTTSGWNAPTVNATNVVTGQLDFSAANPSGSMDSVNILNVNFDIIGGAGDQGTVDLGFTAMAAAATFTDLMPYLCVEDCDYEIESCGILGDVNGDDMVNSTDALIILSCDVGLDVSSFCPMNCGDVNDDGLINSTDALIILAYDVGQSVPFPIGEPGCPSSVTPCAGCTP